MVNVVCKICLPGFVSTGEWAVVAVADGNYSEFSWLGDEMTQYVLFHRSPRSSTDGFYSMLPLEMASPSNSPPSKG